MTSRSATRLSAVELLRCKNAVSPATAVDLPSILAANGMSRAGYDDLLDELTSLQMVQGDGEMVYLSREGMRATQRR